MVSGFKVTESPTAREDGRHACHLQVSEEAGSAIYVSGCLDFFLTSFFQIPSLKLCFTIEKKSIRI